MSHPTKKPSTKKQKPPTAWEELNAESFRILLLRAGGALADAGNIPTGHVEWGIRLLTAERDALREIVRQLITTAERQ